jgi:hypothetical protein
MKRCKSGVNEKRKMNGEVINNGNLKHVHKSQKKAFKSSFYRAFFKEKLFWSVTDIAKGKIAFS